MREVTFGAPHGAFEQWARDAFNQIEHASREDALPIVDAFTVTGFTASRTLNAGTATTAEIANFLATLVSDLQTRGPNRVA